MSAEQALRDGDLQEALDQLQQQVRNDPSAVNHRIFLFQLLSVMGQWDRALTQLSVCGEMDPIALPMQQTYQEAISCEVLRSEVFAGKRSPVIFGEPEQWLAELIQATELSGEGRHSEAQSMREAAFEQAPATSGQVLTAKDFAEDAGGDEEPTGQAFEWIADADSRLGPVLEAIVNGRYYWVPFHRIQQIDIDPPADLRDVVWMPAHFVWSTGGEMVGLIPTRYVDSESNEDNLIRLAKKTDWAEPADGVYHGHGQRLLATDAAEYPLMDVRRIQLNTSSGDAASSATEDAESSDA